MSDLNHKIKIDNESMDVVVMLDVIEHNNQSKYPGQKMLIVDVNGYVYLVPFVEEQQSIYFLKTIMPSRKATKKYLRGDT